MRFKNQVAVVTGAAKGIGRSIALALIDEGARVVPVDVDREALRSLQVEAEKREGQILPVVCDIEKSSDVKAMVEEVLGTFGRIDLLVNNAGIIRRGTIETVGEDDWDRVIAVNLKGTFNCCKAVVGTMKRQRSGTIVNVSSIAGKIGDITSAPGYGSSKAGSDALMKTLARQLAPSGIRVNAVAPHAIETEMSAQWSEEKRREVIAGIPLGRLGRPQDVADAVLFLASDAASFITGEILDVNGGAFMD
ncbi:MAG: SDR family NAD(P)-dependent oxidoreductase [Syntrophales bacterium]|nr:SDR family NAD(P)-dependent oxidoreductase [Syntrophales bacterium]